MSLSAVHILVNYMIEHYLIWHDPISAFSAKPLCMSEIGPSGQKTSTNFDYTEGASSNDINAALANSKRTRRESQYSDMYGDHGGDAVFSGPGHSVRPSSASRMTHDDHRRRSLDGWSLGRRRSVDSRTSRRSRDRRASYDSERSNQDQSPEARRHDEGQRELERTSVLGGLANFFGRVGEENSRISVSRSSSRIGISRAESDAISDYALEDDELEEDLRGYTSAEEDDELHPLDPADDAVSVSASMAYDSEPPSPLLQTSHALPLLDTDPVFGGDTRIDMNIPFAPLEEPPPGPPSRQTMHIVDDDISVRFIGYEIIPFNQWLWRIGCIVSFGSLALLGSWFPRLWIRCVAREKAFIDIQNGFVVTEVSTPDIFLTSYSDIDFEACQ
jgi:cation-transporting P-type ATPase 13A2